ncbi:MAG: cytochrome c1 [Pseudomonadota bacterium]
MLKKLLSVSAIFCFTMISAHAAGDIKPAIDVDFSFEGPFGKFDRAQLQRGFQVYKEVCSACHSLKYVSYRELGDPDGPGFTKPEVEAIAAEYEVQDGPNTDGEMYMRPAKPFDYFVGPYPNPEAATAAHGAYPTDLSLLTKARSGWGGTFRQLFQGLGGPEYVYSVLTGYSEAPSYIEKIEGKYYNEYFVAGPWISMAPPLSDGQIEYADGTAATIDQMAKDVSAFLAWTAEPRMTERKRTGSRVMLFLTIFAVLLYLSYKVLWRNVKK